MNRFSQLSIVAVLSISAAECRGTSNGPKNVTIGAMFKDLGDNKASGGFCSSAEMQ